MAANRLRIHVCGSEYVIATTDSEEYIEELAEKLDKQMRLFIEQNDSVSVTTAAVLTALNYLDEHEKSVSGTDNLRAQVKEYLEDAAKAKMEAEEMRREVENMKRENQRLRKELGYTED